MSVLAEIASDRTLDAVFAWLCKRRKNYPASADVWDFRRDWLEEKARIRSDLRPMSSVMSDFGSPARSPRPRRYNGFVNAWYRIGSISRLDRYPPLPAGRGRCQTRDHDGCSPAHL